MSITPIETNYAGCRFRSRLEARWAVFFDHLGISWEYEPQGYNINGRPYLPDFRITVGKMKIAVEVKGDPDRLDLRLLTDFVKSYKGPDFVLVLGSIPSDTLLTPTHLMIFRHMGYFGPSGDTEQAIAVGELLASLPKEAQTKVWDFINQQGEPEPGVTLAAFFHRGNAFIGPMSFMPEMMHGLLEDPLSPPDMPVLINPKIRDAYTAARSARFEHGEQG